YFFNSGKKFVFRHPVLQKTAEAIANHQLLDASDALTVPLLAFFVAFLLVFLHHRTSGNFRRTRAIAPAFLSALFDVLVLALLFLAHPSQMFLAGHTQILHSDYLQL